ncbi:MAG: helix-turn-helix domain-containing protein [Bacteroidales bacterium]|nr:helix-turn-helix domain-containing protein [Bacteroidales bacterium]
MVDRIKRVMDYAQMSTSAFADKIDIGRSSLTHIFTGRNQPSLDVAKKILVAFPEISTEWLIMGVGNMFQEVKQPVTPGNESAKDTLAAAQIELFSEENESNGTVVPQGAPQPLVVEPENKPVVVTQPKEVEVAPTAETPSGVVATPQIEPVTPSAVVSAPRSRGRKTESNISTRESNRDRISNSQGDKKIVQIIFFYEDKSFDIYTPNA